MFIGNVEINGYAALAPMAGVADRAFRELCRNFGAAYAVTEMVSAKALTMGDKKSDELMFLSEEDRPGAIQLFGYDPDIMAQAAKIALKYSPEIIDINMGCPAPKIVKNRSGSFLMKEPELAGKIVKAVSSAVNIPVTVKIRAGWDKNSINCVDFAKMLEDNGASALTVHARTREQMYAPPIDLDLIKKIKNSVKIPVIGNGDIFTPEDAKKMYEETCCDLVMVGRGAMGKPWLFKQICEYLSTGSYGPEPDVISRMSVMKKHAQTICKYHGEKIGMCEIRKHALWYTKGINGAAKMRAEFSTVSSFEELDLFANKVIELSKA